MPDPSVQDSVSAAMHDINRTWLDRRPDDLAPFFHPDLTMVFPGFEGRAVGREAESSSDAGRGKTGSSTAEANRAGNPGHRGTLAEPRRLLVRKLEKEQTCVSY